MTKLTNVDYDYDYFVRELELWTLSNQNTGFVDERRRVWIRPTGKTSFEFDAKLGDGTKMVGTGNIYLNDQADVRCDVEFRFEGQIVDIGPMPDVLLNASVLAIDALPIIVEHSFRRSPAEMYTKDFIAIAEKWSNGQFVEKSLVRSLARTVVKKIEISGVTKNLRNAGDREKLAVVEQYAKACRKVAREVK